MDTLPKIVQNEYDAVEVIAKKQFATLYSGINLHSRKQHFIKISIDPQTTKNLEKESLFLREHPHPLFPNLVTWNDENQNQGLQIREYIPGLALENLAGKLPEEEILSIATQIARGLAAIHNLGFCYGDMSANNFIYAQGKITFIDFEFISQRHVSQTSIRGTPAFMAPELFFGNPPTIQSDLYGLGALLYYLVTGSTPFQGVDYQELIQSHLFKDLPNPAKEKNNISEEFGLLILRLLNKEPGERFIECNEFIRTLNKSCDTIFETEPEPESLEAQEKIRAELSYSLVDDTIRRIETKKEKSLTDLITLSELYLKTSQTEKLEKLLPLHTPNKSLYYQAQIYNALGKYRETIYLLEGINHLDAIEQENFTILKVTSLYYLGNRETAQELLEKAIKKAHDNKEESKYSIYQNNLGNFTLFNRQIGTAISHYEKAYQASKRAGYVQSEALSLMNLANAYLAKCNWIDALKAYEKAKRIYDLTGNRLESTRTSLNLSGLYRLLGHLDKSRALIDEAHQFLEYFNNPHLHLYACLLESDLEKKDSHYEKAKALFNKADKILESNFTAQEKGDLLASRLEVALEENNAEEFKTISSEIVQFLKTHSDPLFEKRAKILEMIKKLNTDPDNFNVSKLISQFKDLTSSGDIEFVLDNVLRTIRFSEKKQQVENYEACVEYQNSLLKFCDKKLPADYRERFFFFYRHRPHGMVAKPTSNFLLKRILETMREIMSELDINILVKKILHLMMEVTATDRGFVILNDENPSIAYAHKMDPQRITDESEPDLISWTLTNQALVDRRPVITIDAVGDDRFINTQSVHRLKLRSLVILPFIYRSEVMGAVYLDSTLKSQQLNRENLSYLEALADQVGIAIHNAQTFHKTSEELHQVQKDLDKKERELRFKYSYKNFIGCAPNTLKIFEVLDKIIDTPVPVLLGGESGTGKEMIAKIIHYNSQRKTNKLVSVNCGAIPETLLESELFGHVRGAFTGASDNKVGLFEHADGGTLFLDEIGEMPLNMQVKLLRALQEKEIRRVGGNSIKEVDVRIIAASNRDLEEAIRDGKFREDLYYRLNVAKITIPPLRERREDIPLLIDHFLQKYAEENKMSKKKINPQAISILTDYSWPGNVREVENMIYTLSVLSKNDEITVQDIRNRKEIKQDIDETQSILSTITHDDLAEKIDTQDMSLSQAKQCFEKEHILRVLKINKGQIVKTAEHLQMQRTQLSRLLKRYGINKKDI